MEQAKIHYLIVANLEISDQAFLKLDYIDAIPPVSD